jgi:hypothetical protein
MPRIAAFVLAALAFVAVASQLALPPVLERRVEDRLERDGGRARVSLSAFPALRLLARDGDSLEVEGTGVRLDLEKGDEEEKGDQELDRLDGFDEVHVALHRLKAGPLEASSLELTRPGGERAYRMRLRGTTTAREMARFLGSRFGGTLGGLAGDLAAGQLAGGGSTDLPITLAAILESRDGKVEVASASGSIAGLPAGPLAQLVIGAVAERL